MGKLEDESALGAGGRGRGREVHDRRAAGEQSRKDRNGRATGPAEDEDACERAGGQAAKTQLLTLEKAV